MENMKSRVYIKTNEHPYSVYKHTNKTNGKVYIGITSLKPEKRWSVGYRDCRAFQNALDKYGWDNFDHEVLATGLTKEEACEMEIRLIAEYKSTDDKYGYNISSGGDAPTLGLHMPEESKKILSEKAVKRWEEEGYRDAHSNENAYWYGKHHSEETIDKIKANLPVKRGEEHYMWGKHHSEESKRKMSQAKLGKHVAPFTEERKRKISEALTGKHPSEETRKKLSLSHMGNIPANSKKICAYNDKERIEFKTLMATRELVGTCYVKRHYKELVANHIMYKGYYWEIEE